MTEKQIRRFVIDSLQPLCAFAVENPACPGTPDVCTVVGWIELKTGEIPMREDSRVRVTVRKEQIIWIKRWLKHGGRAWTLTVLDSGLWLLHDAKWSIENLGNVPLSDLTRSAMEIWYRKPAPELLIEGLMKGIRKCQIQM